MTATLSTYEVSARTGLSHRQLDYAYRTGALFPGNAKGGSGTRLQWSLAEVAVIARLAEVAQELTMDFGALASRHAAELRAGQLVKVVGSWGEFAIQPPTLTPEEVVMDQAGQTHRVMVVPDGAAFKVLCGWCGWTTETPHAFGSAHEIARSHNRGVHRNRCVVINTEQVAS